MPRALLRRGGDAVLADDSRDLVDRVVSLLMLGGLYFMAYVLAAVVGLALILGGVVAQVYAGRAAGLHALALAAFFTGAAGTSAAGCWLLAW